jgi:hypothetical protein
LSHEVRTHTRHAADGKTVTVHRHARDGSLTDPEQQKRDRFQRRTQEERQGDGNGRTPGERKRRKKRGPQPARAKQHAKKALRLWRRHKVKAALFAGLALGEIAAFGVMAGARKAAGKMRQGRKRKQ